MENYLAQTLLISKSLLQPLCQPICCAQQMSEICVQQICNKKSKLDSDSLLPNTFFFVFAASASPSIADLDLRNFFENTILSRHTTTTKTNTTTTSFVADSQTHRQTDQPEKIEGSQVEKRSWALVAGLPLLDPMS